MPSIPSSWAPGEPSVCAQEGISCRNCSGSQSRWRTQRAAGSPWEMGILQCCKQGQGGQKCSWTPPGALRGMGGIPRLGTRQAALGGVPDEDCAHQRRTCGAKPLSCYHLLGMVLGPTEPKKQLGKGWAQLSRPGYSSQTPGYSSPDPWAQLSGPSSSSHPTHTHSSTSDHQHQI